MPELPEVETVVLGLQEIVGLSVLEVTLFSGAKHIYDTEQLVDEKIKSIKRYGKYLLFFFSSNKVMISHLRMTGQYLIANNEKEKEKIFDRHSHIIFDLSEGKYLLFKDQRKFGTIEVILNSELEEYFSKRKLGPDALLELPDFENLSPPVCLLEAIVPGIALLPGDIFWLMKLFLEATLS